MIRALGFNSRAFESDSQCIVVWRIIDDHHGRADSTMIDPAGNSLPLNAFEIPMQFSIASFESPSALFRSNRSKNFLTLSARPAAITCTFPVRVWRPRTVNPPSKVSLNFFVADVRLPIPSHRRKPFFFASPASRLPIRRPSQYTRDFRLNPRSRAFEEPLFCGEIILKGPC